MVMKMLSVFWLILVLECKICINERVAYVSTERPVVTYWNKNFMKGINITARRHAKKSRIYYVDLYFESLIEFGNNVKWDFYFYEFWGNTYRSTFLELHYGTCDLVLKDIIFGTAVRKYIKTCPIPKGIHRVLNATISSEHLPVDFPFTKGRIYVNTSFSATKEVICSSYIDMEVKHYYRTKQ